MANMSYVRYENTYRDLLEASEHLEDDTVDLSERERKFRRRLIELCVLIAQQFGNELDEDEE